MTDLEKLQLEFTNRRLGTFIHFNSATFQFNKGDTEDWEFGVENFGQERKYPFDESLWDPALLDTNEWARVAKSAGCTFAALTTKHHEGFCLWDSKYSDHCVRNGSDKRDVVKMYLDSFRRAGIEAGLYFSVLDLTLKIGRTGAFTKEKKEMIKGQITELLTSYGEIPFLIVDGWNSPWGGPTYDELPFDELSRLVKSINPSCLLMNIGCNDSIENTDIIFYENAAGQELDKNFEGPGVCCNKFTESWFWRENDPSAVLKSAEWARDKALDCFERNVCFMLNISPDTNGRVDDNQKRVFEELGKTLVLPKPTEKLPSGWLKRKSGISFV